MLNKHTDGWIVDKLIDAFMLRLEVADRQVHIWHCLIYPQH